METFVNIKRRKDIFNYDRFVLTKEMALRAIDLSDINYHGQLYPWLKNARDYNLIKDGHVTKDIKKWSRENRPIENIIRTIKEVYSTNNSRAIVLSEKLGKNRYLISISFAGSIEDADWINNLKMQADENFHKGFLSLAKNFDSLASEIKFPNIGEDLTLEDILQACTKDSSPYSLFITGHSQGGGVAMTYIAKILREKKILDKYIYGITLASPTVALAKEAKGSQLFPIYNIINGEDLITKLGSQIRFGIDLIYQPDEDFRDRFYINYPNPLYKNSMSRAINIIKEIKTTPQAIEFAMGLEKIIIEKNQEFTLEKERHLSINKIKALFLFNWMSEKEIASKSYKEMTGQDLSPDKAHYWYEKVKEEYQKDQLRGLVELSSQAHALNFNQYHTSGPLRTYRGIVNYKFLETKSYYYTTKNGNLEHTSIKRLWPRSLALSLKDIFN